MAIHSTPSGRRERLRRAVTRSLVMLALGALIVGSIYAYDWVTTSPRFAIHHVEFAGLERVRDATVERIVADLAGQNIVLAPLDTWQARLESHPRIARARLRRVFPDRVVVEVVEREPVALVFTDTFYEVDREGMVMPPDRTTPLLDLPVISGLAGGDVQPGRICVAPGLRRALRALEACRRADGAFAGDIAEVRVDPATVRLRHRARRARDRTETAATVLTARGGRRPVHRPDDRPALRRSGRPARTNLRKAGGP